MFAFSPISRPFDPGRRLALAVGACLIVATPVRADELVTIPLQYRTAEQILPVLRPLVGSGAVVTGMQSTLIVRGEPRDIERVRAALAALDRPPRRLMISVRQDTAAEIAASGGAVSGSAGAGGARIGARVYSSRGASDERVTQTVQGLDGMPATIYVGQSVPVRTQSVTGVTPGRGVVIGESVGYRELATGFSVVPRVAGEFVTLDIAPQREGIAADAGGGRPGSAATPAFEGQRAVTTIRGRLGEWLDLGGASTARNDSRILSSRDAARADERRVWVKVEELP